MTIKTKLIANVLVTAVIIVAISLVSFYSMRFLREKLTYLTEKSTPFQMRTIELQRELQGSISALIKVNGARTLDEYDRFRAEAEKTITAVGVSQKSLERLQNGAQPLSEELGAIARELFAASSERIVSSNAAAEANGKVQSRMKELTDRLKELDTHIRTLQANRSGAFAKAMENTGRLSARLKSIDELHDLARELQQLPSTVQNAQKSSAVVLAKGKLNTLAGRIQKNEYHKSSQPVAALTRGGIDKLDEYLKLLAAALTQKNEEASNRAAEAGREVTARLRDLFLLLDQESELANRQLEAETVRQRDSFSQSGNANAILLADSELVALGLRITGEINRLFTLETVAELEKLDGEIRALFARIQGLAQTVENALAALHAGQELKTLKTATAALASIRSEVYGADGMVSRLKKKLQAIERANKAADKLNEMVARQSARGRESVSSARGEQEKAIGAVYAMIRHSLSQIAVVSAGAIIAGMLFGLWIYRSVLLPLRVVLAAVHAQQKQGREKAALAEAVAAGDLSREVTVGTPIALDPSQVQKDEMGMVLKAVVGMSEAQITLDRAFADMTTSLRINREEEERRSRMKGGLFELNTILRGEHPTDELAEQTLNFLAGFLKAGVGIMYQLDEREQRLKTIATYAISRTDRLVKGFAVGEGLPGQVAYERKMLHLTTAPRGYLPIASALGEADPLQIIILPIMHNETLAGVLELGSFKPFGDDDIEFLKQALEGFAIAVNVNRSREQFSELLEQTQSQAEELRVQQEELQQTNEELEERARMLAERHARLSKG